MPAISLGKGNVVKLFQCLHISADMAVRILVAIIRKSNGTSTSWVKYSFYITSKRMFLNSTEERGQQDGFLSSISCFF